jgi:hypothetical protein
LLGRQFFNMLVEPLALLGAVKLLVGTGGVVF